MPELPEVETIRRALEPHVVGRRFDQVEINDPRLVRPFEPTAVLESSPGIPPSDASAGAIGYVRLRVEYPPTLPRHDSRKFTWAGFRLEEHRLTPDYHLTGYESFGDWPNLTAKLAERGFNEVELRKLLGLNFLRVFREVVG